jgi:hypothetical protein
MPRRSRLWARRRIAGRDGEQRPRRAGEARDLGLVDYGEREVAGHGGGGNGGDGDGNALSVVLVGRLCRPLLPAAGASPAPSAFIGAARGERPVARMDAIDVLNEQLIVLLDLPCRLPLDELRNPLPPGFLIVGVLPPWPCAATTIGGGVTFHDLLTWCGGAMLRSIVTKLATMVDGQDHAQVPSHCNQADDHGACPHPHTGTSGCDYDVEEGQAEG